MALLKIFVLICSLIVSLKTNAFAEDITKENLNTLKPLTGNMGFEANDDKKDTLLYFWATWCPDCKDKLTSVFKNDELYKKFNVHLIATDNDLDKIKHFQEKNSVAQHIAVDESKSLQKQLGIFSVPTIVRLRSKDNSYVVVHKQAGGDINSLIQEE